jgi:hypothetical protein
MNSSRWSVGIPSRINMSQFSYDLAVAYRIYPKPSSSRPSVFADDKFKLIELCFQSFKESVGNLKVKLWVLLNNCPPEFEEIFTKRWPAEDLVLLRYPGVPPGTTLHEQSRILMEQTDAKVVYFAEDDYFYLPGQFQLAVEFLRDNPDVDFVTPYEHPSMYDTDLHRIGVKTRQYVGKTWVSSFSTTHTFLTSREILVKNRWLFLTFHDWVTPDLAMWMALTKRRVFNPVKFFWWLPAHRFWSGSIFYAWYYFWRQILFGRRHCLWVASPSIATHMIATQEGPGVDWRAEFQKRINRGQG